MNEDVLFETLIKEKGFVSHQLDSFNDFIDNRLQNIVDDIGVIEPDVAELGDFKIKLGKVRVGKPSIREADGSVREILPSEARLRDLTYAAPIFVEMTSVVNGIEENIEELYIGDVPIMIKSKHCGIHGLDEDELVEHGEDPTDPGGYFVINGTERVLVLVEEIASNRLIVEDGKKDKTKGRLNSERSGFIQRHTFEKKMDGPTKVSFASVRRMPVVVLMKALGLDTDKEIMDTIREESIMDDVYAEITGVDVTDKKDALDYIGRFMKVQEEYREQRATQMIDRYLLPHIGQDEKDREVKAKFLGKCMENILVAQETGEFDDIDHYMNKRIKLAGDLIEMLFRSILLGRWGLITRINYNLQKLAKRGKLPSIQTVIESNVVTNQIASSMATGQWIGGRTGVSQRLERSNYVRTVSHLRNVLSPLTKYQEHFEARELHPTHWGRLCAVETPEGPSIGLRKYLSIAAEVTGGADSKENQKIRDMIPANFDHEGYDVYFNGEYLGIVEKPNEVVEKLREKRRKGLVTPEMNVGLFDEDEEVRINTDSGRVRRPVIVVKDGEPRLTEDHVEQLKSGETTWAELTKDDVIEYLDAEEEENMLVALYPEGVEDDHTHLEIHPSLILGVSASSVPFPEHNRNDRVNYGAKMAGQSLGVYTYNYHIRSDTKSNILTYPQKPIVRTTSSPHTGSSDHPAGQNLVIAVMSYEGYNMEDAVVVNKNSIDRGLGRSTFFRTYTTEEKRYPGGQEDRIEVPDEDVKGFKSQEDYALLTEDGLAPPETPMRKNGVIVGKTSPLRFLSSAEEFIAGVRNRRETSVSVRGGERGVVDKVLITESQEGNKMVKSTIRDLRVPEVGDKFASRHGQKGVIGLIADDQDLPFTSQGVVPDVIFNPHAIPSRMTIGQVLEILAGKTGALAGRDIDATAFTGENEDELRETLEKLGFRNDGMEIMYDPKTGKMIKSHILVGVSYYQKLDHMVANKIHSRARGPITLLTKQPTEGRAKEGGLRLGEMEKDCLVGHGASLLLKERFDSDKTKFPICTGCGMLAIEDKVKNNTYCPVCKHADIKEVEISYAFKLLMDEMKSMCIYPKTKVEDY